MSSLHRRIASRLRFQDYIAAHRGGLQAASTVPSDRAPAKHRALPQLYRELYRLLIGYRLTILLALIGDSMATLLKLIPPAATKAVIDYVILAHPLPGVVIAWSPVPLPEAPKGHLVVLVSLVLIVSVLGKLFGLSSRWYTTRTTKRVQVAVRRKVYEHAMRLPLHRVYQLKSGGASSLLREDAGGVGELIFSMLYNPWQAVVQFLGGVVVLAWVNWRLLLGALFLVPGVYYSDLTLEPPNPPFVSRCSVKSARKSIARRPRYLVACEWCEPLAGKRANRHGSWAKTTSWRSSSFTSGGFHD